MEGESALQGAQAVWGRGGTVQLGIGGAGSEIPLLGNNTLGHFMLLNFSLELLAASQETWPPQGSQEWEVLLSLVSFCQCFAPAPAGSYLKRFNSTNVCSKIGVCCPSSTQVSSQRGQASSEIWGKGWGQTQHRTQHSCGNSHHHIGCSSHFAKYCQQWKVNRYWDRPVVSRSFLIKLADM